MNFDEHLSKAITFANEGKLKEALVEFKSAQALQYGNEEINQAIKMIEEMVNCKEEAAQASAREAELRASTLGITDVEKTIELCTEALKDNPNDAAAKSTLADVYYIRGLMFCSKEEHVNALSDFDEAVKNNPEHLFALRCRGQANLDTENFDQAINDFNEVYQYVLNNPNNAADGIAASAKSNLVNAFSGRANAYFKKEEYANAICDYEKVLEFTPNDATTRELLAMAKAELAKQ